MTDSERVAKLESRVRFLTFGIIGVALLASATLVAALFHQPDSMQARQFIAVDSAGKPVVRITGGDKTHSAGIGVHPPGSSFKKSAELRVSAEGHGVLSLDGPGARSGGLVLIGSETPGIMATSYDPPQHVSLGFSDGHPVLEFVYLPDEGPPNRRIRYPPDYR